MLCMNAINERHRLYQTQLTRPVLRPGGFADLPLTGRLHGYVVVPPRHQAVEGRLGWTGRFSFLLDRQFRESGVLRRDADPVPVEDSRRIGGLPQHQQGGLVAEPHDEATGGVGSWEEEIRGHKY